MNFLSGVIVHVCVFTIWQKKNVCLPLVRVSLLGRIGRSYFFFYFSVNSGILRKGIQLCVCGRLTKHWNMFNRINRTSTFTTSVPSIPLVIRFLKIFCCLWCWITLTSLPKTRRNTVLVGSEYTLGTECIVGARYGCTRNSSKAKIYNIFLKRTTQECIFMYFSNTFWKMKKEHSYHKMNR